MAARPSFSLDRHERRRRRPDLHPARRDAAADRARRGPGPAAPARCDPEPPRPPVRAARVERPRRSGAPADPARDDRLELRPARRPEPAPARPAGLLQRRLRPRDRRGSSVVRPTSSDATSSTGSATSPTRACIRRSEAGGEIRFTMPDTIRAFALERLAARGEAELIHERHARAFADLAATAAPELSGADQRAWLERLEREHDNLRVGDRPGPSTSQTRPIALGLAFHLWRFWQKRGHFDEARRRLDDLAARPWAKDDPRRLREAARGARRDRLLAGQLRRGHPGLPGRCRYLARARRSARDRQRAL